MSKFYVRWLKLAGWKFSIWNLCGLFVSNLRNIKSDCATIIHIVFLKLMVMHMMKCSVHVNSTFETSMCEICSHFPSDVKDSFQKTHQKSSNSFRSIQFKQKITWFYTANSGHLQLLQIEFIQTQLSCKLEISYSIPF